MSINATNQPSGTSFVPRSFIIATRDTVFSLLIAILLLGFVGRASAYSLDEQVRELTANLGMKDGVVYVLNSGFVPTTTTPTADLDQIYGELNAPPWTGNAALYFASHWLDLDHARIRFMGTSWQYLVPAENQDEFVSTLLPTVEAALGSFEPTAENKGYLDNGYHWSGALGLHNTLIGGAKDSLSALQSVEFFGAKMTDVDALEVYRLLGQNLAQSELETIRNALNSPDWMTIFPGMTEDQLQSLRNLATAKTATFENF